MVDSAIVFVGASTVTVATVSAVSSPWIRDAMICLSYSHIIVLF